VDDESFGGKKRDCELGMDREITRRDFLNGVVIGTGGALLGGALGAEQLLAAAALDEFAPEKAPDYYPPARTGIRGNHDGSFTFAHRMRDGDRLRKDSCIAVNRRAEKGPATAHAPILEAQPSVAPIENQGS